MKKRLIVGLTVIFSLLAHSALAAEYTVKKGDCLRKIGRQFNVPWQGIAKAHNIKTPYIIYVGQKLDVPSAEPAVMKNEASTQYLDELMALQVRVCELEQKLASLEASRKAAVEKKSVDSLVVNNVTTIGETSLIATGKGVSSATIPIITTPTVQQVSTASANVIGGKSDNFEAIINGGYYWTANGPDGHGTFLDARVRVRPFFFGNVGDSGIDLGVGLAAYGLMVDGEAGKNSDPYHKRLWAIGPNAKLYGNGWDTNFDLGFGRVNEFGQGYDETQTAFSPFIWYSNYARRLQDKVWFAKTEVGLGMVIPFADQGQRDMRTGELYFTQWIYDKKLAKDVRLSFGLEAGLGYDKGGAGYNFWQLGPTASLELKNQTVVRLSAGYKEKLGTDGDLFLIGATVYPYVAYQLWQASRITTPTEADLVVNKTAK